MTVLLAIIPLFLLMALGFLSVRSGYFAAENIRALAELVLRIALPALIFYSLTGVTLSEAVLPGFIAAYAAGSLAIFATGILLARRLFGMDLPTSALVAIGMACSNSGFMGYPIALEFLGPLAAKVLAQCMIVENLVMIPLAMALGTPGGGASRGAAIRAQVVGLLRNPVVVALAAALIVTGSGLPLPAPVRQTLEMLARMSAPVALFVLGATLAALPLGGIMDRVGLVVCGKLIGHPAAVALAMAVVPGVDPAVRAGGILFAAMPMLSIFPILTQRVGQSALAASALLLATATSFGTLSLLPHLLGLGP